MATCNTHSLPQRLLPGYAVLFKLHAPDEYIAGGAFFLKFLPLLTSLAWAAFGEANGAASLENLRGMIGRRARLAALLALSGIANRIARLRDCNERILTRFGNLDVILPHISEISAISINRPAISIAISEDQDTN